MCSPVSQHLPGSYVKYKNYVVDYMQYVVQCFLWSSRIFVSINYDALLYNLNSRRPLMSILEQLFEISDYHTNGKFKLK